MFADIWYDPVIDVYVCHYVAGILDTIKEIAKSPQCLATKQSYFIPT